LSIECQSEVEGPSAWEMKTCKLTEQETQNHTEKKSTHRECKWLWKWRREKIGGGEESLVFHFNVTEKYVPVYSEKRWSLVRDDDVISN
jgi:hypothetical protein